jgi:hypothetical protein
LGFEAQSDPAGNGFECRVCSCLNCFQANLSHCKTVSSQTLKSFFRNNLRTQTYDKKEQISQTKRDNYSNVPKPSMFIFGLRGRKDDKQFIVDLTRPVDE